MPKHRVYRHAVSQPRDQSIKLISLTQGQNAIVDATDYEWLSQWNWCAWFNPCTESFYAKRRDGDRTLYMHNAISNPPSGLETDHRNGETLNNRRKNLRNCTHLQNQQNKKIARNNVSGFRGVSWDRKSHKWKAAIKSKGRDFYLGRFDSSRDAAKAYDLAALRYHGDFARLNVN
jgi:hypothetical protein